jgi:hypothetical protein
VKCIVRVMKRLSHFRLHLSVRPSLYINVYYYYYCCSYILRSSRNVQVRLYIHLHRSPLECMINNHTLPSSSCVHGSTMYNWLCWSEIDRTGRPVTASLNSIDSLHLYARFTSCQQHLVQLVHTVPRTPVACACPYVLSLCVVSVCTLQPTHSYR